MIGSDPCTRNFRKVQVEAVKAGNFTYKSGVQGISVAGFYSIEQQQIAGFSSDKKGYVHNYGGVTININVPNGDAGEIAEAIKRVLQDTNMIEQAASK